MQVLNETEVTNGDEVDQPCEAFELLVAETTYCGELNENLARNVGSKSVEFSQEDDVPMGQLFTIRSTHITPSIGIVLVGLGRAPPSPSFGPPRQDSKKTITPTLGSRAPITSFGTI